MQPKTMEALTKAFNSLQAIVEELYASFQEAIENGNDADAPLLQAQADRLYEQAEVILALILEYQNGQWRAYSHQSQRS